MSFQKAVKLDPNNKEARYGLGHILAMQGKLPQAEEELMAATKLDENYSEAHTYLGQILEKQGRWTEVDRRVPSGADQSLVCHTGSGAIPSRPIVGSREVIIRARWKRLKMP